MKIFNIFLCAITIIFLAACSEKEDTRDTQLSLIYPPSLLIENLKSLTLISPNNGETYYIDDRLTNNLTFRFDASAPYYSSVILFKNQPTVSREGFIVDGDALCLGGVTNMSLQHRWNGLSSVFSVNNDDNVFYTCNQNSTTDAFSETEKLSLDDINLPKGSEIYWAVLGYDSRYTLTHSSPLRKINIR